MTQGNIAVTVVVIVELGMITPVHVTGIRKMTVEVIRAVEIGAIIVKTGMIEEKVRIKLVEIPRLEVA